MRFLRLLSLLLTLPLAAAAQTTPPAECPTITVISYPGIVQTDHEYTFSLEITGAVPSRLTFEWEIPVAPIIGAKNERVVRFRTTREMRGTSVFATVKITGLPSHCTNTATDFVAVGGEPEPVLVSTVTGVTFQSKQMREMMDELEKNPNSQGYIFIGTDPKTERHKEIEDIIRESALRNGIDQSRLTIVREETAKEIVEIWRVPPGADNPLCRSCEPVVETLPKTGDFYMTDEWGELSIEDELGRLDMLWVEWQTRRSHYLYFYIYRGPAESSASEQARIKRIRDRLIGKRKIPSDHIVIFGGGTAPHPVTRIYTMPPHARHYMPPRPI